MVQIWLFHGRAANTQYNFVLRSDVEKMLKVGTSKCLKAHSASRGHRSKSVLRHIPAYFLAVSDPYNRPHKKHSTREGSASRTLRFFQISSDQRNTRTGKSVRIERVVYPEQKMVSVSNVERARNVKNIVFSVEFNSFSIWNPTFSKWRGKHTLNRS